MTSQNLLDGYRGYEATHTALVFVSSFSTALAGSSPDTEGAVDCASLEAAGFAADPMGFDNCAGVFGFSLFVDIL